jgi:hypothetical protein
MVVVLAVIKFEDGVPTLEVVTRDQTSRLELRKHAIDCRKADFLARIQKIPVNILAPLTVSLVALWKSAYRGVWQEGMMRAYYDADGSVALQVHLPASSILGIRLALNAFVDSQLGSSRHGDGDTHRFIWLCLSRQHLTGKHRPSAG